ncbi:MAG: hypothetical protein O3A63_15040 [Proteobacteria bacterium]|nr:hypothetical protein [Pseudomonadota bacterium]
MAQARALDEWQAMREYWALRASAVYRGEGVPHGDGQLVLVLPGLFGNDVYLHTVRDWLLRIGYRPLLSSLQWNVGCPKRLIGEIEKSLERRLRDHDGEIAIVGHSRGGLFAKVMAVRLAPRVRKLVVVGSPLGGMLKAGRAGLERFAAGHTGTDESPIAPPYVVQAGRAMTRLLDRDCNTPLCGCDYIEDLLAPLPAGLKVTSIYSTSDPIVAPSASVVAGADNIEVEGTHNGLMFNRHVYPRIAKALADRL